MNPRRGLRSKRAEVVDKHGNWAQAHKSWLIDLLVGGIVGGLVGAVAAVNLVIYAGIERGYEATVPEVLQENALIGSAVVAILVAGPVVGGWIARRVRRQRTSDPIHC